MAMSRLKSALSILVAFCCLFMVASTGNAEPISLKELAEAADIAQISVSPDGNYASFNVARPSIAENVTAMEIVVVDLHAGKPLLQVSNGTQILNSENWLEVEPPVWAKDSKSLFVRTFENDQIQISRIDIATGHRTVVTSDAADIESFSLSSDGGAIDYWVRQTRAEFEARQKESSSEGYLADDSAMLYIPIEQNAWFEGRRVTMRINFNNLDYYNNPTDPIIYLNEGPLRSKRIDLDTGVATFSHSPDAPLPFWIGHLLRNPTESVPKWLKGDLTSYDLSPGRDAVVIRQAQSKAAISGLGVLQLVDAATGVEKATCKNELCTGILRDAEWDAATNSIIFLKRASPGTETLVGRWNPATGEVKQVGTVSGILSGGVERRGAYGRCPISHELLICAFEDSTSAPQLVGMNLKTGRVAKLFDANPTLTPSRFPKVETLEWKDALGNPFFGKLVYPTNYQPGTRYPLVISTYYCRGFLRGGSGDEFPEFLFAQAGMLALCVDYSGVGNFSAANPTQFRETPILQSVVMQYERIIDHLDRQGLIDASRVGIGGLSMSSQAVEWALWHSHKFAAAAISGPAAVDPVWEDWMSVTRWEQVRNHYDLPASDNPNDPAWIAESPALNVSKITTPIMVNAAEDEALAGIQFYSKLRRADIPLELYIYPREEHQFVIYPKSKAEVYQRNLDWFRFWLQGYEDPDSLKCAQYARWETMRTQWNAARKGASTVGTSH
jgi:dipeptidyl aminopeptidase/acylaminoacyl peptidase